MQAEEYFHAVYVFHSNDCLCKEAQVFTVVSAQQLKLQAGNGIHTCPVGLLIALVTLARPLVTSSLGYRVPLVKPQ